jgi:hypothetical protein
VGLCVVGSRRRSVKVTWSIDVTQFIGGLWELMVGGVRGQDSGWNREADLGIDWGLLPSPFESLLANLGQPLWGWSMR